MSGPFGGKNIVLGVTGSIAAYKACELASRLVEGGARVHTALTASAREFVGAASFEALTGNPCIAGLFDPLPTREIEHITVARAADLFLIAPATANIIAKAAHGLADDWLSTALLATEAPALFAPAMNMRMYAHPATQANMATLTARTGDRATGPGRAYFVGPGAGALACGDVGPGRLIDTAAILEAADIAMAQPKDMRGKRVLITSGPNHEPIDPVRFLGNRSSGKMGYALAREALRRGAEVTVVSGPATVAPPFAAKVVRADTAEAMRDAVTAAFPSCDVFIAAAAVADYRPAEQHTKKHKRGEGAWQLELTPNPDIAAEAGASKRPGQVTVGFAAETERLLENAGEKLRKKQLDLIVANAVSGPDSALGADSVTAHLLTPDGKSEALPTQSKAEFAAVLFQRIASLTQ